MSSACPACRKASASYCWNPWRPASRLWRRARAQSPKWLRMRPWWNRKARNRWRRESSTSMSLPRHVPRSLQKVSPGWSGSMRRWWPACLWTPYAALPPPGKRHRYHHTQRGSLACARSDIGGGVLARARLHQIATREGFDRLRSHSLGTPREHYVQLLLPASFEAELGRYEGLEALHRSAGQHARTVCDVKETIDIGN